MNKARFERNKHPYVEPAELAETQMDQTTEAEIEYGIWSGLEWPSSLEEIKLQMAWYKIMIERRFPEELKELNLMQRYCIETGRDDFDDDEFENWRKSRG